MSCLAFLVVCHFVLNLYCVITVYSVYGEINMTMTMMIIVRTCLVSSHRTGSTVQGTGSSRPTFYWESCPVVLFVNVGVN